MKAELIDHMGSDLTVVNAARVSFDKESEWDDWSCPCGGTQKTGCGGNGTACSFRYPELSQRDTKLINYLAKHNHFTPFTHPQITLRETVPIFVARQRFKHVVGFSYNEVSRRYVDDEPEFYVPEVWRKRAENKKQGSSDEPIVNNSYWQGRYEEVYQLAETVYLNMVAHGVAPEQARMVLPQSMLTSYYVTGSLAAFARAYKLRIDPHAQAEIQDLAKEWDRIIRPLFPVSWEALTS